MVVEVHLGHLYTYDIDSKLIEKHLTEEEKRLYLREIKKDITFFKKSYQRADLHADIVGLDTEASAKLIEDLVKEHSHGLTASRSNSDRNRHKTCQSGGSTLAGKVGDDIEVRSEPRERER